MSAAENASVPEAAPGGISEGLCDRQASAAGYGDPPIEENAEAEAPGADRDPDLWLYRDPTVAVLKRYLRLSVEVGRLPSLLGREFFRTRAISYQIVTFEDAVILVHDVEKALQKLDEFDRELIATCVLQEYTQDEAAYQLRCWRRTVSRRLPEALDRLSVLFLASGLLRRYARPCSAAGKNLSRGQKDENLCK